MSQSIQLTRHAREQIQMRGIFESEIVQVLNSGAQIVQNPRDSTLLETFTDHHSHIRKTRTIENGGF